MYSLLKAIFFEKLLKMSCLILEIFIRVLFFDLEGDSKCLSIYNKISANRGPLFRFVAKTKQPMSNPWARQNKTIKRHI